MDFPSNFGETGNNRYQFIVCTVGSNKAGQKGWGLVGTGGPVFVYKAVREVPLVERTLHLHELTVVKR